MGRLIVPDSITFRASVTEAELRERMAQEVLEQINALDADGKPLPGVKVTIHRGPSRAGGYTIDVSGPAPARLLLPREGR